jgi:hypothetical protein
MPKPVVRDAMPRRHPGRKPAESSDAIEGQIAEICRDVGVQAKRMRQLQERTDELRIAIREWARQSAPTADREPPNVDILRRSFETPTAPECGDSTVARSSPVARRSVRVNDGSP